MVLAFESVDEILKYGHSNESYWAVLSCGTVVMLYKVVLTFDSVDEILKREIIPMKLVSSKSNFWVSRVKFLSVTTNMKAILTEQKFAFFR